MKPPIENPKALRGAFGADGHWKAHKSPIAKKTAKNKASIPPESLPLMLRALLPNAMQRGADLWQTAQLAAQFSGGGHAGVGAANALRIQFAHAVRAKGYPAPALILGRELVIHCDRLRDLDAALAAGIDLGPLPMMAPLQTPAYVEGFSDEQ